MNGSYNLVTAIAALFIVQAAHKIDGVYPRGAPAPRRCFAGTLGPNPNNLIVVGNRGLGAALKVNCSDLSPDVVMNAPCDVWIVQTSIACEESAQSRAFTRAGARSRTVSARCRAWQDLRHAWNATPRPWPRAKRRSSCKRTPKLPLFALPIEQSENSSVLRPKTMQKIEPRAGHQLVGC